MLSQSQIDAETQDSLTDTQVTSLTLLVKRFPVYYSNLGLFPGLTGKLADEKATPTVKTQALKAVLTQIEEIPSLVVESQGSREEPSHFTTDANWQELALDILNLFYDIPAALARQSYALALPISEREIFETYRHNLRNNMRRV